MTLCTDLMNAKRRKELTKNRSPQVTADGLTLMELALVITLLDLRHTENTPNERKSGKAQSRCLHGVNKLQVCFLKLVYVVCSDVTGQ